MVIPFPIPLTTPPVTTIYFTFVPQGMDPGALWGIADPRFERGGVSGATLLIGRGLGGGDAMLSICRHASRWSKSKSMAASRTKVFFDMSNPIPIPFQSHPNSISIPSQFYLNSIQIQDHW